MKTITIQFGPANQLTKQVSDSTTVRSVLTNPEYRAALGFGDNVKALDEDRRVLPLDSYVQAGANITIETVANSKAAPMITVTVAFGPANEVRKAIPAGRTIGDIKHDPAFKAALGFGDNVKALIDRIEQADNYVLEDEDTVELETVANTKARK